VIEIKSKQNKTFKTNKTLRQTTTPSITSLHTMNTHQQQEQEDHEPEVIPKSKTGRFLEFFFRKEEEAGDKLISWSWLRELPSHLPFAGVIPVQYSPKVNNPPHHQEEGKHDQDKESSSSHFEEYH
jgi:hypothetical protein